MLAPNDLIRQLATKENRGAPAVRQTGQAGQVKNVQDVGTVIAAP